MFFINIIYILYFFFIFVFGVVSFQTSNYIITIRYTSVDDLLNNLSVQISMSNTN